MLFVINFEYYYFSFTDNYHKPHRGHHSYAPSWHIYLVSLWRNGANWTTRRTWMPCAVQFVVRIQFNLGYRVDIHNCSIQSYKQVIWLGYPLNTSELNTKFDVVNFY